jgi:hypothetical protein
VGSWLVEDCEDKQLQQSDLSVSFSLYVVAVAFIVKDAFQPSQFTFLAYEHFTIY